MARSDVCLILVDEEGIQADTEFLRARKKAMVTRIKRRELPSFEIMRTVVLRFVSSGERFQDFSSNLKKKKMNGRRCPKFKFFARYQRANSITVLSRRK
jgi:hypothetical protein